jgi:hypothetical protein
MRLHLVELGVRQLAGLRSSPSGGDLADVVHLGGQHQPALGPPAESQLLADHVRVRGDSPTCPNVLMSNLYLVGEPLQATRHGRG